MQKLLKDYKKKTQKLIVETRSQLLVEKKDRQRKTIKRSGKKQLEEAQEVLITANKGLKTSIKGQFGKKVTVVFEEQKKTLEDI